MSGPVLLSVIQAAGPAPRMDGPVEAVDAADTGLAASLAAVRLARGRYLSFRAGAAAFDPAAALALAREAMRAGAVLAVGGAEPRNPEILRFADPYPPGAVIVEKEAAVAAMERPETAAAGAAWGWALARGVAESGPVIGGAALGPAPRAPVPVPPALAGAYAAARWGVPADAPTIAVYGRLEASASLYFDGLPDDIIGRLRFIEPLAGAADFPLLAASAAVILVRDFAGPDLAGTLARLAALGVPTFYFTDDHYPTLRREVAGFAYYSEERVAAFARDCAGVLATSAALAETFRPSQANTVLCDLCLDPVLAPNADDAGPAAEPCLAIAGGDFRAGDFTASVLPAIRALDRPVRLLARRGLVPAGSGIDAVEAPFTRSFRQFVHQWRRQRPSVLLHPRGQTANARFKTPNALLVAHYLGAVPIVAAGEPAYDGLGEEAGVLRAEGPAAWETQLRRALDPAAAVELRQRLAAHCRRHFAGAPQAAFLRGLLAKADAHPPGGAAERVAAAAATIAAERRGRVIAAVRLRLLRLAARLRRRGS